jgi:hypothetical protein
LTKKLVFWIRASVLGVFNIIAVLSKSYHLYLMAIK